MLGPHALLVAVAVVLHPGSVVAQRPTCFQNAESRALEALDRFRPPIQFAVYGARSGDDLLVVVEVPSDAVAAGRWRDGADLTALAEDAYGQGAGSVEGRLPPSGRTLLRIAVVPRDPIRSVSVRLHAEDEVLVEEAILPAPKSLVGDPLVYRGAGRTPSEPIAILTFSRRETIRLQWPVLAPLLESTAALLDAGGRPVNKRLNLDRADPSLLTLDWRIPRVRPGDYLIELTATGGTTAERRYLAIRID